VHTLSSIQNVIRVELLQVSVARPAKPGYCKIDAIVVFFFHLICTKTVELTSIREQLIHIRNEVDFFQNISNLLKKI
jgi:hypothetical protein